MNKAEETINKPSTKDLQVRAMRQAVLDSWLNEDTGGTKGRFKDPAKHMSF